MFLLIIIAALLAPTFGLIVVYVARCYSVVLTESSTGIDRIRWPKDRFTDWIGDAWLVLVVLVALVTLTAILAAPLALAVSEQAHVVLGLAGLFVWLAFPVVLCTAHHPTLIAAMPRRIEPMLLVVAMTTPLCAAAGFGVALTLQGYPAGTYIVAVLGPPAILIHARAWGRFVWLALNERSGRRRKPKSNYEPEAETAFRPAKPTAAARAVVDEGDYVLESSDWTPEPGHLAEHYEIQRERERWKRLKAGEERVDPLGRSKAPKPWTALAASKIFGVLLQGEAAAACVCMALGMAILSGALLAARLAI